MHAFGLSVAIPKSVFPGHYFTTRDTLDSILCRTPAYLTNMFVCLFDSIRLFTVTV
jgi:hypothetical protein